MSTDAVDQWIAHAIEVAAARREAEVLGALLFVAAATGQPLWRVVAAASEPAGWSARLAVRLHTEEPPAGTEVAGTAYARSGDGDVNAWPVTFRFPPTPSELDLRIDAALALHSPVETEAEFYCHDERGRPADEGCATFDECPGHMLPMTVCSECGHDHEDGYPMYRPYPCPTRRALET